MRLIVVTLLSILTLSACKSEKQGVGGEGVKTLVYCSEGSPSAFNPQIVTDGTSLNASGATIYSRLVEFKEGETSVVPGLAENWEVSPDAKVFTFNLKKGIHFHTTEYFKPTRDLNADDVIWSFERQMKKDHPYHKVNGGNYEYFVSMEMDKVIKEIKKIDDYKIQFILNRQDAPFLANLAMDFASVLSKEYGEQLMKAGTPEKIDFYPVGSGPFIFVSYQKDTLIRYKANPDYFLPVNKVQNLVFSITPDASVRYQKLKAGECNIVTEPAPADLDAMKKDPNLNVISQAGLNVAYLAFNVTKKEFSNKLVREAVYHALNRASYIDAVYMGNAEVAKNPIPPTMWSYNNSIVDYDYNIEKAKELMKKAGYPNGFSVDLWTMPVSRPYNPNGKKMGELMQADLEKIGIKLKLVTYDWGIYLDKTSKGEHSLAQLGWTGDNGDPDNFLAVLLGCSAIQGGGNAARWCNPEFEKLIQAAKATTDIAKRTALYSKAQEIFHNEIPWVPIANSKVFRAMSKNVIGFKLDPFGKDRFYGVDLQ